MKNNTPLYVFILGLILTFNMAQATEPAQAADSTMCSTEKDAHCDEKAAHTKKSKNKDWTHKRLEQVEAVMPQPTEDKSKSDKPEMVKLASPKFLSTVNGTEVKLEWTKSENAKVYHVQVSKDAGFNNRAMYVVNNNNVADNSLDVKNLEPGTKYFWRVAAANNAMKDGYTKSNFASSAFTTK